MTADRWQKLKEVFQAALDAPPEERQELIRKSCASDQELLREVQKLFDSHQRAQDFIENPAITLPGPPAPHEEQRFGPYRVLRQIGSGGMGAVYLGVRDDDQFRKRVAIKVVQTAETDEILRRFRHERQILASLEHPNIARLLDGGATEDGKPYFVMDYVEGTSLLEYCNTNRLSIGERLELFQGVCSAVHYVHQNLIVHRDLKPGNILVTSGGVPKLLDFGIAKLLKPELMSGPQDATRVEMRLMTPGYASPEQVRGEPITTATDVYSLGVILYELLAGRRPYRWKTQSLAEITTVICEYEPGKPSDTVTSAAGEENGESPEEVSRRRASTPEKLRRQLRGDLDAIVLKAMRKEPQRRYASAGQLSEDIHNYLGGQPVSAHSGSLRYRTGKFIRRHRVGVAAASFVALSLLAGIMATAWQAQVARAERARAERRFQDVRKLANSFLFEFHDSIKNLPGSTPARELVVKKALEYLDSLSRESAGDNELSLELAQAYQKVGDVQGNPFEANLGDTAAAQQSFRKSVAILEPLLVTATDGAKAKLALASGYQKIADTQLFTGNRKEAAANGRKALDILEALVSQSPDEDVRRLLVICLQRLGDAMGSPLRPSLNDPAAARQHYERARQILDEWRRMAPTDREMRTLRIVIEERIGILLENEKKLEEARDRYATVLDIAGGLHAESPQETRRRRAVAAAHGRMGKILSMQLDYTGALKHYETALRIAEKMAADDPLDANAKRAVASLYGMTGNCLAQAGNSAGARQSYRKALAIVEDLFARDPKNVTLQTDIEEYRKLVGAAR
jgi:non-specific serine/threonine protein kinase/serine/threonine-protein kinase